MKGGDAEAEEVSDLGVNGNRGSASGIAGGETRLFGAASYDFDAAANDAYDCSVLLADRDLRHL